MPATIYGTARVGLSDAEERKLIATPAMFRDRPRTIPSATEEHEWFTKWLPSDEQTVRTWEHHFIMKSVPYRRVDKDGCPMRCIKPYPHHHVYTWTMLYIHRISTPKRGGDPTWCCT